MENEEGNIPVQSPLNNSPDMNQLREAIRNDPSFLQNIMSSLAQTNPQLLQVRYLINLDNINIKAISSNPEEFLRMLQEGGNEEMDDEEEEGILFNLKE